MLPQSSLSSKQHVGKRTHPCVDSAPRSVDGPVLARGRKNSEMGDEMGSGKQFIHGRYVGYPRTLLTATAQKTCTAKEAKVTTHGVSSMQTCDI